MDSNGVVDDENLEVIDSLASLGIQNNQSSQTANTYRKITRYHLPLCFW